MLIDTLDTLASYDVHDGHLTGLRHCGRLAHDGPIGHGDRGEPLMTCRHRWAALAAVPGRARRAPGSSSGCAACPVRAYADQAGVWQACVQPRTAMPSVVTVGRPLVPATMIFRVCLLDHDQVLVQIACR